MSVTIKVTDSTGATATKTLNYTVSQPVANKTIIGFSAKPEEWVTEMNKLGTQKSSITARRLFCDLADSPRDNETLIRAAVSAGLMPVLSYKIGGNVAGAKSGALDANARAAGQFLASLDVEVKFVIWHEPNGDLSPADFVAINRRLAPLMKSEKVKAGCFINGFLLLSRDADFTAFMSDSLVSALDWVGIDAYHDGTMEAPNPTRTPGQRIGLFLAHCERRGITKPIGIGEYNGFSGEAIRDAGNLILNNAQIEFACMWSSQASADKPDFRLTGERLTEFRNTLSDPRVLRV